MSCCAVCEVVGSATRTHALHKVVEEVLQKVCVCVSCCAVCEVVGSAATHARPTKSGGGGFQRLCAERALCFVLLIAVVFDFSLL